jgi:hypothetical protein
MNKRSGSRDGMGSAMDDSQQSPTDGKLAYLEEGAGFVMGGPSTRTTLLDKVGAFLTSRGNVRLGMVAFVLLTGMQVYSMANSDVVRPGTLPPPVLRQSSSLPTSDLPLSTLCA